MNTVQLIFEPHPEQPGRIDFMTRHAYDWSGSILAEPGGKYAVHFVESFIGFYQLHCLFRLENGTLHRSVDEAKAHVQSTYDNLLKSILS